MSDRLPDFYELTKEMERTHGLAAVEQAWREISESITKEKEVQRAFFRQILIAVAIVATLFILIKVFA